MSVTRMILLALCIPLFALPAHAQEPLRVEHSIDSKYPEQERTFTVQLPPSYYRQTGYDYPVLYLLDGESNLDYSVAVAD